MWQYIKAKQNLDSFQALIIFSQHKTEKNNALLHILTKIK